MRDGIESPIVRELTLGVDQQLSERIGVGATYYRRMLRQLIGSRNMAVLPNDYTQVTITNPLTSEPLTVYNQKAETVGRRDTVVGNQNELDSDYNGLELRLNSRFTGGFAVIFSSPSTYSLE
jgi:hypothetical protein